MQKSELELYDREAEEITLGCILLDSGQFPLLYSLLKPQEFFSDACRHTYQAMINLSLRNVPIDQFLVYRELVDLGWREDTLFLSKMVYQCPTSEHLRHYATIVKKFSTRRAKLNQASQITKEAFEEKKEIRGVEL